MYDLIAPTVLVMIISYITASMFMEVFAMIIDAMIVCYCTDCEQNEGKPLYASEQLSTFLKENGKIEKNNDNDPAEPHL